MANPLHIERMRSINFRLSHDCARIEAACGGDAWDREQIIDHLRISNAFGKCAMNASGDVVLGYILYRVIGHDIEIDRMLVRLESRYEGVGSAMLQRLKERVGRDGIRRVVFPIECEENAFGERIYPDGLNTCLTKNGFLRQYRADPWVEFIYEG